MSEAVIALTQSQRMVPLAAATSGLIHALAALALAWSLPPRAAEYGVRAIDVTFESIAPPPPLEQILPHPEPLPAVEITAEIAVPPPPGVEESLPDLDAPPPLPAVEPSLPEGQAPPPPPAIEAMLPEVEAPPPPSPRELARLAPVAPRAPVAKPKAAPPTPPPVAPDVRERAQEDYLLGIVNKLSQVQMVPRSQGARDQGIVITRLTVARDGRLIDAQLTRSSGSPALDRGVIETLRRAAPFAPLPRDIADDQVSFTIPISFARQ